MSELTVLRATHAVFASSIEELRRTADAIDVLPRLELWDRLAALGVFVDRELLPHATAEDEVLFPAVAATAESSVASDTLRVHHDEIMRLADEFDDARKALLVGEAHALTSLRRVLYSLYAVIRLHIRAEEEVVLPVLEAALDEHDADAFDDSILAVTHDALAGSMSDATVPEARAADDLLPANQVADGATEEPVGEAPPVPSTGV